MIFRTVLVFVLWGLPALSQTYYMNIKRSGITTYSIPISDIRKITFTGGPNEVGRIVQAIEQFRLLQNYPNPFNPSTFIEYEVPTTGPVRLVIYDITGRLVRTLVDRVCQSGTYRSNWDASDDQGRKVATGAYIYQIQYDKSWSSRKMLLVK